MGVSYIPGPEAILGPALGQIGQAIAGYISPNAEFQKAIQRAIAVNPQLIQQLTDMEAQAPGSLMNLGFGEKLTGTITKTPESADQKFKRDNAGTIEKGRKTALSAENVKNEDVLAFANFLKDNPTAQFSDFMHRATGENEGERLRTGELKKVVERGNKLDLTDPKQMDIYQVAKDFRKGIGVDRFITMMSNSLTQGPLELAIKQLNDEDARAQQLKMLNERGTTIDNYKVMSAIKMWDQSGNAGDIKSWEAYMHGGQKERALELSKKDRASLSFDDRQLVDVYNADVRMNLQAQTTTAKGLTTSILQGLSSFRAAKDSGATDSELQMRVADLQGFLDARGELTGKKITVVFKNPKGWAGENLYFEDANGNQVDVATALDEPKAVTENRRQAEIEARAVAAATAILADPDPNAAMLRAINQDNSPGKEVSTAIQKELNRRKKK